MALRLHLEELTLRWQLMNSKLLVLVLNPLIQS